MTAGWQTNPWREFSTRELLAELEARRWDLADVDKRPEAWDFVPESRAFLVHTIRELNGELSRRRSLADSKLAPAWPANQPDRMAELAEIKRRVSLTDLIGRESNVDILRIKKGEAWCCCPLPGHREGTPSFHIDEEKQVWHCFGCKRGGDLFELARHLWSEPLFARVADRLRAIAGLEPPPTPVSGPGLLRSDGAPMPLRIAAPRPRAWGRG